MFDIVASPTFAMQLSAEEANRFAHLIDALRYGCPPHGGIALGTQRSMIKQTTKDFA